ncbi:MAG: hypothetical protein AB8B72_06790 [Crocinitomicaceae bacterium]
MKMRSFIIVCFLIFSFGGWSQTNKQKYAKALANNNISLQLNLAKSSVSLYSDFTYAYYQLMITSLPKNSVVITNSIDDTFPIQILQSNSNIRPDIQVITLSLLSDSLYLRHVNSKYKIQLYSTDNLNSLRVLQSKIKRVYISTTVKSKLWFKPTNFITGLTVQKGNQSQAKSLLNFYLKYQKLKIKSYSYTKTDLLIIRNVLPPLITLYNIDSSIPNLKSHILELARLVKKVETVKKMIVIE